MPSASLTSKGQVTIPKTIRELLGVKAGDRVDFVVENDNVVLRPGADLRSLRGSLHRPGRKPVSLAEMDAALSKAHSRARRSSRRK